MLLAHRPPGLENNLVERALELAASRMDTLSLHTLASDTPDSDFTENEVFHSDDGEPLVEFVDPKLDSVVVAGNLLLEPYGLKKHIDVQTHALDAALTAVKRSRSAIRQVMEGRLPNVRHVMSMVDTDPSNPYSWLDLCKSSELPNFGKGPISPRFSDMKDDKQAQIMSALNQHGISPADVEAVTTFSLRKLAKNIFESGDFTSEELLQEKLIVHAPEDIFDKEGADEILLSDSKHVSFVPSCLAVSAMMIVYASSFDDSVGQLNVFYEFDEGDPNRVALTKATYGIELSQNLFGVCVPVYLHYYRKDQSRTPRVRMYRVESGVAREVHDYR